MNSTLDGELKKICSNKVAGSNELLEKINSLLLRNYQAKSDFNKIVRYLEKNLSQFQTIASYLQKIKSISSDKTYLKSYLKQLNASQTLLYDQLFRNSYQLLKKYRNYLTISNSQTLLEIFKLLKLSGHSFKVCICESRPGLEGRIFATKLLKLGVMVSIITEAQSAEYIQKSDCVLLGADCILNNKNIINKIGSLQLAVLARYFKKPCYVITDKSKFSTKRNYHQSTESRNEIWRNAPAQIKIKNTYFEVIPKSLVTRIISN